jgi:chromosome segregation ATPase
MAVITAPAPEAPQWLQVLLSVLGILGGSTGLAAIATVMVQRGKFKADAADTLTEAALTLVQPLQARITELEREALDARSELGSLRDQVNHLQFAVQMLSRTLERWRAAIGAPDATLRKVRAVVAESERLPEDR